MLQAGRTAQNKKGPARLAGGLTHCQWLRYLPPQQDEPAAFVLQLPALPQVEMPSSA